MKRISIFCDGTWNTLRQPEPTNVARAAAAVMRTGGDGAQQVTIYLPGVGSGEGSNGFARWTDRVFGGAFGWGLDQNVAEAYRHLAFNYAPGDEVFIFGFSRGAYTARSLAGLIRSCGIPGPEGLGDLDEALAIYRARGEAMHPDAEKSLRFRHTFSPRVATSAKDQAARSDPGDCFLLRISYLGVWDTVGALGVPEFLLIAPVFNGRYKFHDTDLSSSVQSARHAVAVDERRKTFPPTLWCNLDRLNEEVSELPALTPVEGTRYLQHWFPGDHGSVGGGGDIKGLSSIALDWVLSGAEASGLTFEPSFLEAIRGEQAALGTPLVNQSKPPSLLTRLMRASSADRTPPKRAGDLSAAAQSRLAQDPDYRPPTLKPYWP